MAKQPIKPNHLQDSSKTQSSRHHPPSGRKRLGRGLSSLMAKPVQVLVPEEHTDLRPRPGSSTSHQENHDPIRVTDVDTKLANPAHENQSTATGHQPVSDDGGQTVYMLALDAIAPNPYQPRKTIDPERLNTLAQSIRSAGVMQPILVRRSTGKTAAGSSQSETYELIAGERRWRAATIAGLKLIPSIVCELDDAQTAEWALVENLQREDLDPIERAQAFQMLIDQFGLTQSQIAERVGFDRSSVANTLRLNNLDEMTQLDIRAGRLSQGHAKILLSIADPILRRLTAEQSIDQMWSVRALERHVESLSAQGHNESLQLGEKPRSNTASKPDHVVALEEQISQSLGLPCRIVNHVDRKSGKIVLTFHSINEFESFIERLN